VPAGWRIPGAIVPALAVALSGAWVFARAQAQSTFRAGVDVIVVDVQVMNGDGAPVAGLRPDQFSVSIDGKPRQVLSADFVSAAKTTSLDSRPAASPPPERIPDAEADGRVYILLFDAMSFRPLDVAPAREAAHRFVEQLQPNDLVGLAVFPRGAEVQPTTDREPVLREIDRVIGMATPAPAPFPIDQLSPSELVDVTKVASFACQPKPELMCLLEYQTLVDMCR